MTILTPERLAEIKGRLAFDDERGVTHPHAETLRRLLASHAALQAEVERLRSAARVFSALCDLIFDDGWGDSDELELYSLIDDGGQLLHRFKVGEFRALASEVKP